jgi:membrane-associated phospholipid phosphatase
VYDMPMYQEFYEKISRPLRERPWKARSLIIVDRLLVVAIAAGYCSALAWLCIVHDPRFYRVLLVPAVSFVAMSIGRAAFDAPRPYETYPIDPLVKKKTRGKSFPGRHVFSATIIACALGYVNIAWGIDALAAAVLIACARVAEGVHFPRDVIAGAVLALTCGALGFILLP